MGCFVFISKFLQFLEGKVANVDYEFACEHEKQVRQDNCSYFIIELDSLYVDLKDKQKQENNNQKNNNIIAGILYSDIDFVAQKVRAFILNALKTNIYFQLRQYQEGFRNILIAINDYIKSSESGNQGQNIGINLYMRTGDNIFLSNTIRPMNEEILPYLNDWKILLQNDKSFRKIDKKKELILQCEQFCMVKEDFATQIKEIMLTSHLFSNEQLYADLKNIYPLQNQLSNIGNNMYFLKLKNINL